MTTKIPSAQRVADAMLVARQQNEVRDPAFEMGEGMFYGPARLMITHTLPALDNQGKVIEEKSESILLQLTWDHSDAALAEAADAARRRGGRVFVGQDVYGWSSSPMGRAEPTAEGFSFEVWPAWTGVVKV
jgi:hypothetical protein